MNEFEEFKVDLIANCVKSLKQIDDKVVYKIRVTASIVEGPLKGNLLLDFEQTINDLDKENEE